LLLIFGARLILGFCQHNAYITLIIREHMEGKVLEDE